MLTFCFILLQSTFNQLSIFVDSLEKVPAFLPSTIAVSIRNTTSNETFINKNANKSVNSASILKLISTGAAIVTLGSDFSFKTQLEHDGYIENGVLYGNIYLKGNGDPSLGSERFGSNLNVLLKTFSRKIKELGIKKVEGQIIGDGSVYGSAKIPDSWIWGDIGNYYGATAGGLNINENKVNLYFNNNNSEYSHAPISKIEPNLSYLKIKNEVYLADNKTDDETIVYGSPFSDDLYVKGTIPKGKGNFRIKASIMNPELAFAFLLEETLKQDSILCSISGNSIENLKTVSNYYPKPRTLLFEVASPPLSTLIKSTNFESLNIYADAILKAFSFQTSKDASFEGSTKALNMFASNKGINLLGVNFKDGSGLSPSGFVTANFITEFLQKMTFESNFVDFSNSIPVVGQSGTVKSLCKNTKAEGKIKAKSGSIEGTRAFAGYFTKNNEQYSFSIIINHYDSKEANLARKALEKMMILFFED